jgi:hypothetical protein
MKKFWAWLNANSGGMTLVISVGGILVSIGVT